MAFFKLSKKQIIIVSSVFVLVLAAIAYFVFENRTDRVFTKSEYIKEVVVQNDNFNDLLDKFLDQTTSYNGTKEATEKLENTANKFSEFVAALKIKLGPKVPHESAEHYKAMMEVYDIYLEAISMYKKAVPKNLGEDRTKEIGQAAKKLMQAEEAMKNISSK